MKTFHKKAFPYEESYMSHGMDLRDYIAIEYINGIVSNPNFNADLTFEKLAEKAYELADVVMEARGK